MTCSTSRSLLATLTTVSRWSISQYLKRQSFADRGYVKQKLAKELLETFNIEFFAKPRRNMKNKLMRLNDKLLSRKRSIVETLAA